MSQEMNAIMVDLYSLSTPRESCVVLHTGRIDPVVLRKAIENRFDQLPVLDGDGRLCGMIETEHARSLHESGQTLDPDSTRLTIREILPFTEMFDLLDALGESQAIIIRRDSEESVADDWFALTTISDLNRHSFRAYLYPLFAQLESAMAELIDRSFDDPWMWIPWTPSHTRPVIIGRWELDKRDGVDTTPLTGCELRDMMSVIGKSVTIRKQLGLEDDAWKKLSNSLPELRNDVMHPVRSLVDSKKKVQSLRRQLNHLVGITSVVTREAETMRQEGRGALRYRP